MTRSKTAKAAAAAVTIAAAASTMGVGSAHADYRTTPAIQTGGGVLYTMGLHSNCHATLGITVKNDPRKHGWIEVGISNRGNSGRSCAVGVLVNSAVAPRMYGFNVVPSQRNLHRVIAKKTFFIGSGVNLVGVTSKSPASVGTSYYINIP